MKSPAARIASFVVPASLAGIVALGCGGERSAPSLVPAGSRAISAVSSAMGDAAVDAATDVATTDAAAPTASIADPQIDALIKAGLASRDALGITASLTDEVGPRMVGSAGYLAAVTWAQAKMTALGLSNVHTEPVHVERWERGGESGATTAPYAHRLELAGLGLTPPTPAGGIEADIVEVDSLASLEAIDAAKIKGKIVLFNKLMQSTADGSGYGHAVDVRVYGGLAAAKKGAKGALVRSITASNERFAHTGVMRTLGAKGSRYEGVKAVPSAAISVPDADMIHRLVAAGKTVRVKFKLASTTPPPVTTANVVGEIPGTTAASEVVLFGAHLDSWDLATGAQDDGAGCAIVLEGAHLMLENHVQPERTIRVVLYAGEEYGGFGAKTYAEAHASESDRIVAALEADEGSDRVYGLRVLGDANATFDRLAQALAPLEIKRLPGDAHGGSDTEFLRPGGVPLIDLQQDMSRYFDLHHTTNDVLEEIEPKALAQAATAYAVTGTILGKVGANVGRVPADKRKEK